MARGVLLFAHGARDPRWAVPFEAVAQRVRAADPALHVRLAFLEFIAPTLREAGDDLAREGCARVDVVPLFLGAGGHVRKDLPLLVAAMQDAHPQVRWRLQPAVGELDAVIAAMAQAALDLAAQPDGPDNPRA
jgi:sirohydrochlorin cobaltochelatase